MEYTYNIYHENKSIIVQTTGDLETNAVVEMELVILLKAKELKYKIVFDYRLSKNKISISEAYYWFSNHFDIIDNTLKNIPRAYLANIEDWNFYCFFETTCYNKCIPVNAFKDENLILEWLKTT